MREVYLRPIATATAIQIKTNAILTTANPPDFKAKYVVPTKTSAADNTSPALWKKASTTCLATTRFRAYPKTSLGVILNSFQDLKRTSKTYGDPGSGSGMTALFEVFG